VLLTFRSNAASANHIACLCASDRLLNASPVYFIGDQAHNEALPGLLASVLAKMNASPHDDVKEIDVDRPYIALDEKIWTWQRIAWPSGFKLNRRRLPTASRLILLQDLGFGKDGRVWKACSFSGLCCVVKFSHSIDSKDSQTPLQRLQKECDNYALTGEKARVITLSGQPALLLPHFSQLDLSVPKYRQMAKTALQKVIQQHKLVPTDRQRKHLMLSSPDKVAVIIDRADWRPLAQDESPEEELRKHLSALQLN